MPLITSHTESGNIANGFAAQTTQLSMPSLGMATPVQQRSNKNPYLSLPFPASQALQNSTPSQQYYLLADLTFALVARQTAVSRNTHKNNTQAWKHHLEYCNKARLVDNLFLDGTSRQQRIKIMGAFSMAMH